MESGDRLDVLYLPALSLALSLFSQNVMSQPAHPPKRRRAVLACHSCRHRKSRVCRWIRVELPNPQS